MLHPFIRIHREQRPLVGLKDTGGAKMGNSWGSLRIQSPIIEKCHNFSPKIVGIHDGESHFQPKFLFHYRLLSITKFEEGN